jgi:hypothetical protein
MNSWHSYPSIYALGHRAIADLLTGDVLVEEKIDGSQFSFGVTEDGEIKVRSKGAQLHPDAPEKMFTAAVASVKERAHLLRPGWTYRGEYLAKPKHNSLAYDRIPRGHIIVFDINSAHEEYLPYEEKQAEAERIGLETVALIYRGKVSGIADFRMFLDRESVLGGQKIEGVVVKPVGYAKFGLDKKCLLGKFVSEAFKEVHAREWKASNPGPTDIVDRIAGDLHTTARWDKAVLHLRERGVLEGSPRDIGALIKEVPADIRKEESDYIKDKLFAWAWPQIQRKVTHGLPEWYKDELLKQQFENEPQTASEAV